jgi:hypothetical protein
MHEPRLLFQSQKMASVIEAVQFSPDSQWLAAGGHDRVIDIYRCAAPARTCVQPLELLAWQQRLSTTATAADGYG